MIRDHRKQATFGGVLESVFAGSITEGDPVERDVRALDEYRERFSRDADDAILELIATGLLLGGNPRRGHLVIALIDGAVEGADVAGREIISRRDVARRTSSGLRDGACFPRADRYAAP